MRENFPEHDQSFNAQRRYSAPLYVSYFDHFLSGSEILNLRWFSHREATLNGHLAEFRRMAISFARLYRELSTNGAFIKKGRLNYLEINANQVFTMVYNGILKHDSSSWDIFIPEWGIRIISGWDFTDEVQLRQDLNLSKLDRHVKKNHLYLLR